MKKFILTGPPGCGKTSIIHKLASIGHTVVFESATDVITRLQEQGIEHPWKLKDFQLKIVELQQLKEKSLDGNGNAFLDRGIIDSVSYEDDESIRQKILEAGLSSGYEKDVFFIELIPEEYRQTRVRKETLEEAKESGKKLEKVYLEHGFNVIRIPAASVDQRIFTILEHINDASSRP
jgi:predicted ATPase